jgi:hypothetical protein
MFFDLHNDSSYNSDFPQVIATSRPRGLIFPGDSRGHDGLSVAIWNSTGFRASRVMDTGEALSFAPRQGTRPAIKRRALAKTGTERWRDFA